jgi:hypothetical protein
MRGDQQVLENGEIVEGLRDLEGPPNAGEAPLHCGHARDVACLRTARFPESGVRLPVIRLKSVDLPAPFGPMMPKASPSRHREADIVGHLQLSEALGDVVEFED